MRPMDMRSCSSEEDTNETRLRCRFVTGASRSFIASVREVHLCVPFRIPSVRSPHWRNYMLLELTEIEDTSPQGEVPSGTSPLNVSASSAWRHSHLDAANGKARAWQ